MTMVASDFNLSSTMQPLKGKTYTKGRQTQNVFGDICGEDTGEQADFDLSSALQAVRSFEIFTKLSHNRKVIFSTGDICEE